MHERNGRTVYYKGSCVESSTIKKNERIFVLFYSALKMPVMGTVTKDRTLLTAQNELVSFDETEIKGCGHAPSKKNTKTMHQPPKSGISLPAGTDSQRLRRTRRKILIDDSARQHNTKIKSHTSSKNGQRERRQKQSSNSGKESSSQSSVKAPKEDSSESRTQNEGPALQEDSDTASDLSDSERRLLIPSQTTPPDLNLRAEVIDPPDFRSLRLSCRGRNNSSGRYPDFLPPPFNSWSLKQLAVYLNTDGKGIPHPKPVGPLERYLDRLLLKEWHQIQTVQEECNKSSAPTPKFRHWPHTSTHSSLSSPKCILQCQRAFPLALLSSLASAPTLQLPSCSSSNRKNRYPITNGMCRPYAHHQDIRLSPLLKGKDSGFPKRSYSESRAHQLQQRHRPHKHRLSDPLSESSHLKHMQAIGNIRHPVSSTNNPDQIFTTAITDSSASFGDVKMKMPGQRSRSCVGMREVGYQVRGRSEQRRTKEDSKHSITSQLIRKQKHVEFDTK
ncbi:uncharacterized protein fam217bb [Paramisgurnus dabryanus]|uniref:uncharacterized protein fam217bb n=1 Tax=Paramisgurnus dabryanus TaxID=90735 RepID=UPI0031F36070